MFRALTTLFKIAMASLITGAMLNAMDLSAEQILLEMGLTPESVMHHLETGFRWAMPNIILGSMVILPIWFVVYLFRPPRG